MRYEVIFTLGIAALSLFWLSGFVAWTQHVDSKFKFYAERWHTAWHVAHDKDLAWRYWNAQALAHEDLLIFNPRQWFLKWHRDYFAEATTERR